METSRLVPGSHCRAVAGLALWIVAFSGQAALGQDAPTANSFEGVWKVTKVVKTGPNAFTDTNPQPSLQIFYRGYFTILRDNSSEPRRSSPAAKDPAKLTDEEKIARYEEWAPYGASGGTYEVKGDSIITHNVVAKQVRGVGLTEEAKIVSFVGDTFVVRPMPLPNAPTGEVVERTYTRIR